MSFVKERERRPNAGSRMNALLNQEVEMEELFDYRDNEDTDEEFSEKETQDEEDKVDSDFDLDSSEGEQEHTEEGKALDKEIEKQEKKSRKSTIPNITIKAVSKPAEKQKRKREIETTEKPDSNEDRSIRQSSRRNTMLNRILLEGQMKEDKKKKAAQPKKEKVVSNELSQEELIAEAMITEKKNMSTLLEWQKKEEERRSNAKVKEKREIKGPYIKYHSYKEVCQQDTNDDEDIELIEPWGRNFVTFVENPEKEVPEDLELTGLVEDLVRWLEKHPKPNKPIICPISGDTALYKDPRTSVHYSNMEAYKIVKSCLNNQMKWSFELDLYLGDLPSANDVPENWGS